MSLSQLQEIQLKNIQPDKNQPRKLFPTLDELIERKNSGDRQAQDIWDRLLELSTSILEVGLQQPILVYPAEENGQYIILDGHRRWLATSLLYRQGRMDGTILCYIQSKPDTGDILLEQLNANIQREDLTVFELARSLKNIYANLQMNGGTIRTVSDEDQINVTELPPQSSDLEIWEAIEKKMGFSRSRRYQIQSVLDLPPRIQEIAEKAALSESRLRYLKPIKDEQILEIIIREIAEKNLSNSQIKTRIEELQKKFIPTNEPAMPKPMQIQATLKPLKRVAIELGDVHNVSAAISAKDPRTVQRYKELLPEIRGAISDLEGILKRLEFLDEK